MSRWLQILAVVGAGFLLAVLYFAFASQRNYTDAINGSQYKRCLAGRERTKAYNDGIALTNQVALNLRAGYTAAIRGNNPPEVKARFRSLRSRLHTTGLAALPVCTKIKPKSLGDFKDKHHKDPERYKFNPEHWAN